MTINSSIAARTMAQFLDWDVTNLKLQKMLYIAHLFFLGRHKMPLVDEDFEAWDYGPVLPSLYHNLKFFGSDNIMDVFPRAYVDKSTEEYEIIKETAKHLADFTSGQLVNITHHKDGAWARHYKPRIKKIKIPNESILEEYTKLYQE